MLVLTRRAGQELVIADEITISVVEVRGNRVLLGITAPRSVSVDRFEVRQKKLEYHEIEVDAEALV